MKVLCGALLAAALLVGTAQSLVCYTCDATTNTAACNNPTICPSSSAYCMTVTATSGGVTAISKSCQQSCREMTTTVNGVPTSSHCCTTDLCNGAVQSLVCYTCDATTNTADCNVPTVCPSSSAYCMTVDVTAEGVTAFSKSCQKSCTETTTTVGSYPASTHCCSTNLCNAATTPSNYDGAAQSLVCYTCDATTNTAACKTQTSCPSSSAYCMTVTATAGGVTAVSKSCQKTCREIPTTIEGLPASTQCCSTNLCNGAANVRLSYTMLFLAAGASVLLLKAGL
ncbi:uncharacterized protein [Ambystoma mexicanum]|uniref:uncharacterized protein n=1 Tax=Ambystoma mexicanum TaxID=8296 RepID=UPI0037E98D06